jgi:tetratricopeptide (TPR) repeat protein
VGDNWALAHAEGLLGELAQAQGRYADATVHLASAANSAGSLGFEAAQAHHLLNLGRALHQTGDPTASMATLEQAINIGQRCGDFRTVAFARTRLAQVLRTQGETASALDCVERAVHWFTAAGGGDGARLAGYLVAALHADRGLPMAPDELSDILEQARGVADQVLEVLTLDALAAIDVRAGNPDAAQSGLAVADRVAANTPQLWVGDRLDAERVRSQLAPGPDRTSAKAQD